MSTVTNPHAASRAREQLLEERRLSAGHEIGDVEIERHIEEADSPETVTLDINGDVVEFDASINKTVGQFRQLKDLVKAEERNDETAAVTVLIEMAEELESRSDRGREFWDGVALEAVGRIYSDWIQKAAAGNE